MKAFVILGTVLLALSTWGATPGKSFEGCYETVSVNGTPVKEPTAFYKSKIKYDEDIYFTQVDGKPILSLFTAILMRKDDVDTIVEVPLGFTNAPGSVVSQSSNALKIQFNGSARLKRNGQLYTFQFETLFEKLGAGRIRISYSGSKNTYELMATKCP